ncbi:hypothetical protein AB1Y20_005962 [Prymnesium parvum]|uniref:DNA helicase n=1 Tax=Prymnesium parvum TaxID=97485 RepID=A0AB34J0W0_PRYPA
MLLLSCRTAAAFRGPLHARARRLALRAADEPPLWSPSELTLFVESPWASWLERLMRAEPSHPLASACDAPDAFLSMLSRKGGDVERALLEAARRDGEGAIVDLSAVRGSREERVAATARAIEAAPALIYQAPLSAGGFFGVADFLVRVPAATPRYMVWDAKLSTHARPSQLLQLCCYSEMLRRLQGEEAEWMGLLLGGSRPLALRTSAYAAYYRHVKGRFLLAHSSFDPQAMPPPPSSGARAGRWSSLAAAELSRTDDLRLVATLGHTQAARLHKAGVHTAAQLADATPPPRVSGISPDVLARLQRQAALQRRAARAPDEPPPFECLAEASNALASIPPPHASDVFFDLEGFPFADGKPTQSAVTANFTAISADPARFATTGDTSLHPAGREYLWGLSFRPPHRDAVDPLAAVCAEPLLGDAERLPAEVPIGWSQADAGVGGSEGRSRGEYVAWWAHDFEGERDAFMHFVDLATQLRKESPGMHIYHYGAYEISALRRLAGRHGTREEEVDQLLRDNALVDLYPIVRKSIAVGEPRYSIKNIERLYRPPAGRDTAVAKGDQSVAVYDAWLRSPDGVDTLSSPTLASLREYNRDDCESTRQLADWLWALRQAEGVEEGGAATKNEEGDGGGGSSPSDAAQELEEELARVEECLDGEEWAEGCALGEAHVRATLKGLLRYHKREAKPVWWRRFDWLKTAAVDLITDPSTLGGLRRTATAPYKASPKKRRLVYEYAFDPPQDCHLLAGSDVVIRRTSLRATPKEVSLSDGIAATLHSLHHERGIAAVECSVDPGAEICLLPNEFVDAGPIAKSLLQTAAHLVATQPPSAAFLEVLSRRPANLLPPTEGKGGVAEGDAAAAAAVDAVLRLDDSYLCVQGPPGTGKTHTGARAICELVLRGRRVGVMAVSHRAIANLMERALRMLSDAGVATHAIKLGGAKAEVEALQEACARGPTVSHVRTAGAMELRDETLLIGATAWGFAHEALAGQLDVLFVDEAGQLPLAHLGGAARSARKLVLLGDQMQLPAPSEGHHPGTSGLSCLEYLLQDEQVVPPEMGVFLPTTYRMHPRLCELVSEISYGGRLVSHESCAHRTLQLGVRGAASPPQLLKVSAGVQFMEVEHSGNTQKAVEEVHAIAQVCDELLRSDIVTNGRPRPLTWSDILVVAPYNQQVRALSEALGESARVGTVDRFQGQEAPVVIISLCHSQSDDGEQADFLSAGGDTRGVSFVLNQNRMNVALSRAQCLALVFGSPHLLRTSAKSVAMHRELNYLCRVIEYSDSPS